MKDFVVVVILKMHTTTFVTFDPKNFNYVGSILKVMLPRVPFDNDIIKAYREIPNSGVREIPASLQAALATVDALKKEVKKIASYCGCIKENEATKKAKEYMSYD
ncbi:unnamed protein product [Lactuca virosa]|uniref:Uncharacterized protein n=1 Tax=Lactuca virosa TaxID=75947 RepID=A0AAU9P1P4_9ASTR|nr:unnamed protein product [Lactuca virosa]